jgi:hypothetical protein
LSNRDVRSRLLGRQRGGVRADSVRIGSTEATTGSLAERDAIKSLQLVEFFTFD